MYFNMFPQIAYDIKGDGEAKAVTNILKRVALRKEILTKFSLFDIYDVQEGETPESVADFFYGDSNLHWLVCYCNNIVDRYHDWPMRHMQFLSYVNDKYSNPNAIHHYEITQESGDTKIKINVGTDNTDHSGATAITNYEYEEEEQNKKRQIRLLNPLYVADIVEELQDAMKESAI